MISRKTFYITLFAVAGIFILSKPVSSYQLKFYDKTYKCSQLKYDNNTKPCTVLQIYKSTQYGAPSCKSTGNVCVTQGAHWADDGTLLDGGLCTWWTYYIVDKSSQKCNVAVDKNTVLKDETSFCLDPGICGEVDCSEQYSINDGAWQKGKTCKNIEVNKLKRGEPLNSCKQLLSVSGITSEACCSDIVPGSLNEPIKINPTTFVTPADQCCKGGKVCCKYELLSPLIPLSSNPYGATYQAIMGWYNYFFRKKLASCAYTQRLIRMPTPWFTIAGPDAGQWAKCDGTINTNLELIDSLYSWIPIGGAVIDFVLPFEAIGVRYRWTQCSGGGSALNTIETDEDGQVAGVNTTDQVKLVKRLSDPSGCSFDYVYNNQVTGIVLYSKKNYTFIDLPYDAPASTYTALDARSDVSFTEKEGAKLAISDTVLSQNRIIWYWNGSRFMPNGEAANGITSLFFRTALQDLGLNPSACQSNPVPSKFETFLSSAPIDAGCTTIYYGDTDNNKIYNSSDLNCMINKLNGASCLADTRLLDLDGNSLINANDLVHQLYLLSTPAKVISYFNSLDYIQGDNYGSNFAACADGFDSGNPNPIFNPRFPASDLASQQHVVACPNGYCEEGETPQNCPQDCGPAFLEVKISNPNLGSIQPYSASLTFDVYKSDPAASVPAIVLYGANPSNLNMTSTPRAIGVISPNDFRPVIPLINLTPSTTYYYQPVASRGTESEASLAVDSFVTPPDPNPFPDGGFETGTGNWTNLYGVSTVTKDTSTLKTGTASLKWIDTDTGLNNTASYRNFDNLEVIKGKTINVSFWYKIPFLNPESSAPLVVRIDRNGSGGGLANLVSKRYPVSEWTYISQNIKIPADATYVRLQINKGNWYTTATVNLDDVKIQLVNATCGNGIVETGEACDNGSLNGQQGKCNKYCSGIEPVRTYLEAENAERLSDASVFSFSGAYGQAIKYNSTYNIYGFAQLLWPVDLTKTYNIWTRQYRPSGSDRRLCLYKSDHSYCYGWKQDWFRDRWEWVYQGKHKLSDFTTTGGGNRIIVKGNGSGGDLYLDQILFVDGDDFDPQYPR